MATEYRDQVLEEELKASRTSDQRKTHLLVAFIGLVALATIVGDGGEAIAGIVPAMGRVAVAALGLAAAALLYRQPARGWQLAMVWAVIQIPVFALSPDGSATSQALQIPIAMTSSTKFNGEIVLYSSIGINLIGVIVALWLRAWRDMFD